MSRTAETKVNAVLEELNLPAYFPKGLLEKPAREALIELQHKAVAAPGESTRAKAARMAKILEEWLATLPPPMTAEKKEEPEPEPELSVKLWGFLDTIMKDPNQDQSDPIGNFVWVDPVLEPYGPGVGEALLKEAVIAGYLELEDSIPTDRAVALTEAGHAVWAKGKPVKKLVIKRKKAKKVREPGMEVNIDNIFQAITDAIVAKVDAEGGDPVNLEILDGRKVARDRVRVCGPKATVEVILRSDGNISVIKRNIHGKAMEFVTRRVVETVPEAVLDYAFNDAVLQRKIAKGA